MNQDKYVSKLLNYIYLTFHSNQNLVKSSVGNTKPIRTWSLSSKRLHYNNRGRNRKHPALKLGILEKQIKDAKASHDEPEVIIHSSRLELINTIDSWFLLCTRLTLVGLWAFWKAFCGSFTRLHQSPEERASKKRGHLKRAWKGRGSQASGGKEGKNFQTKGAQQQSKGRKQRAGVSEPLVIRRSYAPGKMGGYGRETAGRLPEAGWLTERPLSLHLNKGPCRLVRGDTLTYPRGTRTRGWGVYHLLSGPRSSLELENTVQEPCRLWGPTEEVCLDRKWQMGELGQSFRVNSSSVSWVPGIPKLFCWALPRRSSKIYNQLNKAVVDNKPGVWSIEI